MQQISICFKKGYEKFNFYLPLAVPANAPNLTICTMLQTYIVPVSSTVFVLPVHQTIMQAKITDLIAFTHASIHFIYSEIKRREKVTT